MKLLGTELEHVDLEYSLKSTNELPYRLVELYEESVKGYREQSVGIYDDTRASF